jgi:non-lysosomal glucosylceramidase
VPVAPAPQAPVPLEELLPPALPSPWPALDAAASPAAAFPLGGVGTGNVSLGSRGELRDWEIWGRPGKGNRLPYTFAAVWCRGEGIGPVARVLEARLRPPYQASHGLAPEQVAGLPRLGGAALRGEYPLVRIDFTDERLPLALALEAFTPMVPLDPEASGLPMAFLTYRATNRAAVPLEVAVVLSMANPVGWAGPERGPDGRGGRTHNRLRTAPGLTGLVFTSERYGPEDLRYGSAVLAVEGTDGVTVKTAWQRAGWWDAAQDFWDDFSADGALEDLVYAEPSPQGRQDVGSLGLRLRLRPGQAATYPFVLAWHFPNRPATWHGSPEGAPRTRTYYAVRFADAWAVAEHAVRRRTELTARTREFHRRLFGGTLPPAVLDAAASNLAVLRSPTCFWLEGDGRGGKPPGGLFLAWEGCGDQAGCCAGDCTHVWNYAQAGAFLYPQLEQGMRAAEFGPALHEDGQMDFRVLPVFGERWDHAPALDGQAGSVVRLYREWRLSGDRAFLERHYPAARRALQFCALRWDPDGDGLPEADQHNTYDIEFYGPNPLGAFWYLAALRAGEELARAAGDQAFAEACCRRLDRGRARAEEVLWNGAYYVQRLDDVDAKRYQFGAGCLADQLVGQLAARVAGLGYLQEPARVRTALASVFRHNFRPKLEDHACCQRTYALHEEGGLLLCTWPEGGRPRYPFPYADEVWTGVEYQVAAHLLYEGLVEEGLQVVAQARARHRGWNRNPWDECECGHHYARSLASWSVLLALAGWDYDAPAARLCLAPCLPGPFRCLFSVPAAWGTVEVADRRVRVLVAEGRLPLREVGLHGTARVLPPGTAATAAAPLEVDF